MPDPHSGGQNSRILEVGVKARSRDLTSFGAQSQSHGSREGANRKIKSRSGTVFTTFNDTNAPEQSGRP